MGKRAQNKVKAGRKEIFRKPETTPIWQKLGRIQLRNKEKCLNAFLKILDDITSGKYNFQEGSTDMGEYFIVNEAERQGSSFVHIVPAETYKVFEEMRRVMSTSFLGFSILCGKFRNKDLRVSCFAIPAPEITRALISRRIK